MTSLTKEANNSELMLLTLRKRKDVELRQLEQKRREKLRSGLDDERSGFRTEPSIVTSAMLVTLTIGYAAICQLRADAVRLTKPVYCRR